MYMHTAKERAEHMREMFADPRLELSLKEIATHTTLRIRYELITWKAQKLARKRQALADRINADIKTFDFRVSMKDL